MKKKTKTPLALQIIPAVFPMLERILPSVAARVFTHFFFTPIGYGVPGKELKAETFAKRFELSVKGKRIRCYQWGEAPKSVLVVHGWAGRATQFRRFVKPLLAAGFQVVGFDGPAHGKSDGKQTNLTEFLYVIQEIEKKYKNIIGIVAHSYGGVASLYSIAEGLPVKALVNIASPTIGDEVINTYLKALGGSAKTGKAFKEFIMRKYGKTFDEFSALAFVKRIPTDFNLMLVHDENDKEVSMQHPNEMIKLFPQSRIYTTSGLGHTRILRDNEVIRQVVTFMISVPSES